MKNNKITLEDYEVKAAKQAKAVLMKKQKGFKDNGKYSHEGLTVGGCGMDMVFHTLECFLQAQGVKDAYHYAGNYKLI